MKSLILNYCTESILAGNNIPSLELVADFMQLSPNLIAHHYYSQLPLLRAMQHTYTSARQERIAWTIELITLASLPIIALIALITYA